MLSKAATFVGPARTCIFRGLDVGVDGYYKIARDLLDDGQFGAALVLDGFNYAKAYNQGIEIKAD